METELRLRLPGDGEAVKSNGSKRGYVETMDLKLNISSMEPGKEEEGEEKLQMKNIAVSLPSNGPSKPPAKAQVVGWPPVRSFRKNMAVQKKEIGEGEKKGGNTASFVKVSMDGAPYLRKVDLKIYKNYRELSIALRTMFSSFTIGEGIKDFMNERKPIDLVHNSEYVHTYEDKDGDWMLVGDVPWEMFVDSCERLRIMKGSKAIGIGN